MLRQLTSAGSRAIGQTVLWERMLLVAYALDTNAGAYFCVALIVFRITIIAWRSGGLAALISTTSHVKTRYTPC
jgi:hypothetical protein